MRTSVIYPLPLDAWSTFEPFVKRFTETWKRFHCGVSKYQLCVVCNWGEPTDKLREMFYGIQARFFSYYSTGCDAGSWQHMANILWDEFIVATTTRTYFHRAGWLERFVGERKKFGSGLYTSSASHEGGKLHACCRCFGTDASDLRQYIHTLDTRDKQFMEIDHGDATGNYLNWIEERGKPAKLVTWDGAWDKQDWFTVPNRFRDGDQSNVLVWDKHTDAYKDASPEEKERLAKMANTGP